MSTTFDAALDVKTISPHPANPRRKVLADPEMVASIKAQGLIQPLIVAPASTGDGYVLIAGHRRLDGLKKARKKTAPVVIRSDLTTDAEQLECAVIENVHRVDLSPMEEAEAFEQLRGLKYTQKDIAAKTGRPVSTVRDRLKLLKLSKKTRDSIHDGQLTIGDALEIVAFDDDAKAQTALVKAAEGTGFRMELEKQKRLRQNRQRNALIIERLTKDGVTEYDMKGARDIWEASRANDELKRLFTYDDFNYADALKKHEGCLAYIMSKDWDGSYTITLVCTASSIHQAKQTKAEREAEQAAAERLAMWEAEREQQAIAKKLRMQTVLELVPEGAMVPDFLVDQLRVVLPPAAAWIYGELGDEPDLYFEYAGVPDGDRFKFGYYVDGDAEHIAFVPSYDEMPGWRLTRLLMAVLLELVESQEDNDHLGATFTSRYFSLLEQVGHPFTEHDTKIRDDAEQTLTPEPAIDPYDLVHTKGSNGQPGVETPCGLRATTGKTLTTNPEQDNVTCTECHESFGAAS